MFDNRVVPGVTGRLAGEPLLGLGRRFLLSRNSDIYRIKSGCIVEKGVFSFSLSIGAVDFLSMDL